MSKVEVNQISSQCGSTLTIGQSGDTVTLAAGATQSGFGRTGTVNWDTTAKTASFTAVSGNGYFVNTTSGAVTVTLPATPSAGDIVAVADYSNTADTNNITIGRNSSNIEGNASDFVLNIEGASITFVYVDVTKGWIIVNSGNSTDGFLESFITATGGSITTIGDCKIHTFTGPGTFCVSQIASTAANNVVSYMVVAGGGGGGNYGGGGGAGGFREYKSPVTTYTASPLDGNPGGTSVTVTATAFPITVGGGGTGSGGSSHPSNPIVSTPGANSVFSTITAAGGGGAGKHMNPCGGAPKYNGQNGGSGGGAAASLPGADDGTAGSGNTPPVTPSQGNNGGTGKTDNSSYRMGGGGGGATAAGTNATTTFAGAGGNGATTQISGSPTAYAGGGGGGTNNAGSFPAGAGGTGGGGDGTGNPTGNNGTANTGGGGGGVADASVAPDSRAPSGGSGIVIIRYRYQ